MKCDNLAVVQVLQAGQGTPFWRPVPVIYKAPPINFDLGKPNFVSVVELDPLRPDPPGGRSLWIDVAPPSFGLLGIFLAFDFTEELDPFRTNPSGGRSLRIDVAPPRSGLLILQ